MTRIRRLKATLVFNPGERVRIVQDDRVSYGVVVEDTRRPTVNRPGTWIEVDRGEGAESLPSYLLERITVRNCHEWELK